MTAAATEESEPAFFVVCPRCGEPICFMVKDSDESWNAIVQWSYLAQKEHDRECRLALAPQI